MRTSAFSIAIVLQLFVATAAWAETWDCEILPKEQKEEVDPQSGTRVIFVTTNPAVDTNFYFHERCFLHDDRLMLFNSQRPGHGGLMGYLTETGELVRLTPASGKGVGSPVASRKGDRLYGFRGDSIYEWIVDLRTTPHTAVSVTERKLVDLPEGMHPQTGLNENSDATMLAFGCGRDDENYLGFFDLVGGKVLPAVRVPFKPGHLQCHWQRPDMVSICQVYGTDVAPLDPNVPRHARIWTMSVGSRAPVPAFYQVPGEIATHECWWVNDQMTFIGGFHHDNNREEGAVKVLDFKTGEIRVIGQGAWVEGMSGKELAQYNWWHAAGSPDGRWVAADNWHGIVALFNAKTTEKKILVTGHRTYGSGQHLHVGWDTKGRYVEFTSNKLGNPDVCLVAVPQE